MPEQSQTLAHLGNGHFMDITDAMQRVSLEVMDTGQPGKITVTLTLKPGIPGRRMIEVAQTVTVAMPRSKPTKAGYFVGDDGELLLNDPKQAEAKIVARSDGQPEFRADNQDKR